MSKGNKQIPMWKVEVFALREKKKLFKKNEVERILTNTTISHVWISDKKEKYAESISTPLNRTARRISKKRNTNGN